MNRRALLVLTLLILSSLALRAGAESSTSTACVDVDAQPYAANPAFPGQGLHIKLTNNCGKDIMAIDVGIQTNDPQQPNADFGVDFLPSVLLNRNSESHPFFSGTSYVSDRQLQTPTTGGAVGSVSVTAVIFIYRTSGGNQSLIDLWFAERKRHVSTDVSALGLLNRVSVFGEAQAYLRGEVPKEFETAEIRPFWKEIAQAMANSTQQVWPAYITSRRQELTRHLELYRANADPAESAQ